MAFNKARRGDRLTCFMAFMVFMAGAAAILAAALMAFKVLAMVINLR